MATGTIPTPYNAYGLGAALSVTDANDANQCGWYAVARNGSHLPIASPCVIFAARRSDFIVQIAWAADNHKEYTRYMIGTTWSAWTERGTV